MENWIAKTKRVGGRRKQAKKKTPPSLLWNVCYGKLADTSEKRDDVMTKRRVNAWVGRAMRGGKKESPKTMPTLTIIRMYTTK